MIFNIIKSLGYTTKLDSYYYDNKRHVIVLVLKIRFKRAVLHVPLDRMLQDKKALSNMHPIDLCIIGVLANQTPGQSQNNINNLITVADDFLMMKIQQTLEIKKRDFTGVDEKITLNLTPLNREITISASELYKNKKLMHALKYHDAIALGYTIKDPNNFLKEGVVKTDNSYRTDACILNGLFFCILLISTFLLGSNIKIDFLWLQLYIKGEILLLPLLFILKNQIIKINGFKNDVLFFFCTILALSLFISYYSNITKLPFPANSATEDFNSLYYSITNHPPKFFICLIFTVMTINCLVPYMSQNVRTNVSKFKGGFISCSYISVFFLSSLSYCLIMKEDTYSIIDFGYSLVLTALITLLFPSIRSFKWIFKRKSNNRTQ